MRTELCINHESAEMKLFITYSHMQLEGHEGNQEKEFNRQVEYQTLVSIHWMEVFMDAKNSAIPYHRERKTWLLYASDFQSFSSQDTDKVIKLSRHTIGGTPSFW